MSQDEFLKKKQEELRAKDDTKPTGQKVEIPLSLLNKMVENQEKLASVESEVLDELKKLRLQGGQTTLE